MAVKPTDWKNIFPIMGIEEDAIVSNNGDVTIGFSLMLREIFTMSERDYMDVHDAMVQMVSKLPIGTTVHKQDFFYTSEYAPEFTGKENISQRSNMRFFAEFPVLKHYSNLYISIPTVIDKKKGPFNNSTMRFSSLTGKNPLGDIDKIGRLLDSVVLDVLTSINSLRGYKAIRMDGNQLWCSIGDFLTLNFDEPLQASEGVNLPPVKLENGYFKVGEKYVNLVSMGREGFELTSSKTAKAIGQEMINNGVLISDLVPAKRQTGMTYPITFGLPFNHVVNWILEVSDNDKVLGKLKNETNELNILKSLGYYPAMVKQQLLGDFVQSVIEHKGQTCNMGFNLIVFDNDLKELQRKVSLVSTAFSNMNGTRSLVENEESFPLFMASCPGNGGEYYRNITNIVQQAITYMTKETHYRGDLKGNLLMDRFGSPTIVDTWDEKNKYMTNRNGIVIGPSGSGKSFGINLIIDQIFNGGDHIVLIDIGRSYETLVKINNGLFFDSANPKLFRFNIFLCERSATGKWLYAKQDDDFLDEQDESNRGGEDRINFIYTVIATVWKKGAVVSGEAKSILKDTIKKFYDHCNDYGVYPVFNNYYEYLEIYKTSVIQEKRLKFIDFDSIQLMLEPFYKGGQYEYVLNSDENIDLTNERLVVFELESISKNEDLFGLICVLIIELVAEKVRRLPKAIHKRFLIDEALDFLKSDLGDYIAYLYRTFRKKGGQVLLATQTIKFFDDLRPELTNSIMANSDFKIFLDHSKHRSQFEDIKRIASLTDSSIELLDSLETRMEKPYFREALIIMGTYERVFRLMASLEASASYTTHPVDLTEIAKLFDKTKNIHYALKQFAENKRLNEVKH